MHRYGAAAREEMTLAMRRLALGLVVLSLAIPLAASESQALVYGCSIAGNWTCNPTPNRCDQDGSGPVMTFPNSIICERPLGPKPAPRRRRH